MTKIERSRLWQKKNKKKAYENHKIYRDKNREKLNQKAKEWREANREEMLKRRRLRASERKKLDPLFKLSENIRSLICMSFKRGGKKWKKVLKTEEILGCSITEFISYLLSKCPEGITYNDFHRFGYQIDHIIPVKSATTEEELIKLNHYTNLQPLFWRDNIQKSDKLT